jgi:hypothetical protein
MGGPIEEPSPENTLRTQVWLFQAPIFRLFHLETPAVAVFFLVTGYAISYRSLQLMSRLTDPASRKSLYSGLLASVFRWSFQLYLPYPALP